FVGVEVRIVKELDSSDDSDVEEGTDNEMDSSDDIDNSDVEVTTNNEIDSSSEDDADILSSLLE
ncbi:MAG: hypothetical protein QG673_1874, partial [Pseudomonadota bacterium]|nr:hypothetical protein [Pseudomonadota bacterium]